MNSAIGAVNVPVMAAPAVSPTFPPLDLRQHEFSHTLKPAENLTLEQFASLLQQHTGLLIASHAFPDPDALGASCGLAAGLRPLGLNTTVINQSAIPERLTFIPGAREIVSRVPEHTFDAVLICDCLNWERLGNELGPQLHQCCATVLNLDHHLTNTFFAPWNCVRTQASSSSELAFELLSILSQRSGIPLISPEVATALYAGISGDTGSFRHSNTSAKTLAVASALVEYGADPAEVAQQLYCRESRASVLIQAQALSTLRFAFGGRVALATVPLSLLNTYQGNADDTIGLVEKVNALAGVEIAVLLRQVPGYWTARMRTKSADYDLTRIAQKFGDGGHRTAAGFRLAGSLEDIEGALLPEIASLLATIP